jgi:mRNA-degrading endonuclease toxin of MazEF toxin-antitoxin module
MKVKQGEIIEVPFVFEHGVEPHPAIVISNNDINENENTFVAVMMTTTKIDDEYSFWTNDDMFSIKPKRKGQVRLHLVSTFTKKDVMGKYGTIRQKYLEIIIDKIYRDVLNIN